jgi:hypothetical protein
MGKLPWLMFAGRDGCSANAKHQRQRQRYICLLYGPPNGWYAWFAMSAMFGPWQLKLGDYQLIVKISGVWGVSRLNLLQNPIFFHQDICTLLDWELSWGTKSLLTAFAESAGDKANYPPQKTIN